MAETVHVGGVLKMSRGYGFKIQTADSDTSEAMRRNLVKLFRELGVAVEEGRSYYTKEVKQ